MTIITVSQMYWLTRLDMIKSASELVIVFALTTAVVGTIAWICHAVDEASLPKPIKYLAIAGWLGVILGGAVQVFVPTTKEMLVITIVPQIVNNQKVQKVATDSLGIAQDSMKLVDSWIADKTKELIKEKTK